MRLRVKLPAQLGNLFVLCSSKELVHLSLSKSAALRTYRMWEWYCICSLSDSPWAGNIPQPSREYGSNPICRNGSKFPTKGSNYSSTYWELHLSVCLCRSYGKFGDCFRRMTTGSCNLPIHLLFLFISPPVLLWRGLAYLFVLDISVYLWYLEIWI